MPGTIPNPGWNVVAFEQPTAAKWSQLGENDDALSDGTGIQTGVILTEHLEEKAIQHRKLEYGSLFKGVSSLTASPIPTSETDISGSSIAFTPDVACTVLIFFGGHFQLNSGGDRQARMYLNVDGSNVDSIYNRDTPGSAEGHADLSRIYKTTMTSASHTVKLRGLANTGSVMALDGAFWFAFLMAT